MEQTDTAPVVLVTGASSGIGLALARRLWQSRYRVVITARQSSLARFDAEALEDNSRFLIRPLDVTAGEQRRELIREIEQRWGGVDILVNNAGITYRAVVEHLSEADEMVQLETNYLGPMELIRLVLPGMRRRRRGRIINISSVGGMMAMPTMGAYSASKFALEGASEALWYEMRPHNVQVVLVQPGFVHSNSFHHVRWTRKGETSVAERDEYAIYYGKMGDFIERLMGAAFATPDSIAATIVRIMEHRNPPLRVAATLDARFFYLLRRLLPRRLYHWVLFRNLPGIREWGTAHED